MNNAQSKGLDMVAAIGLVLGGVFGIAGTFVGQAALRQIFWAIDGTGIVVAAALLAVKYLRRGNDCVAAGFIVFVAGETLVLSEAAGGLEASVPSFAAGILLWAAGLLLICLPKTFAIWIRAVGVLAAILFAVTAARIFLGEVLLPTAAPLPSLAYPLLVLTFAGWIWTLLRSRE